MSDDGNTDNEATRTLRASPARPETGREEGVRPARPAAARAEDLQYAWFSGGRPLRPLRQRADGRGRLESGRGLRPVRLRAARLRPVRALRHRRPVRVSAADPVACVAQGRPEQLHLLRATQHGRARDQVRRPHERAESVRRPVQVETSNFRGNPDSLSELPQPEPRGLRDSARRPNRLPVTHHCLTLIRPNDVCYGPCRPS